MTEPNDQESPKENPYQSERTGKSSGRCCIYGCLLSLLLVVVVVVGGGFSAYWWFKGQVTRYTSDTAANLPTVEFTEEELAETQGRIDTFKEQIEKGETPEDLVLTADELNALITKNEDLRGRVYLTIEDGEVSGDVSIPTDAIPGGEGRFFNASATFNVSLENGVLIVTLVDAEVKGEKIPQQFIEGMSQENLAKDVYKDPEVAAMLRRFESISIEHDKIILKPRIAPKQTEAGDAPQEKDQPPSSPATESKETTDTTEPGESHAEKALPSDAEDATETP